MELLFNNLTLGKSWLVAHATNFKFGITAFLASAFASICGYFSPVGEILLVLFVCIIADLITGIWAARAKGQGIKSKRLCKTAVKIGLYFGIVMLIFSVDHAFSFVQLTNATAWLIVGFEVYSVLENIIVITDHPVFRAIKRIMRDKVKETTGVDIEDENQQQGN